MGVGVFRKFIKLLCKDLVLPLGVVGIACSALVAQELTEVLQTAAQYRNHAIWLWEHEDKAGALEAIGAAVDRDPAGAENFYWRAVIRSDEKGKEADLQRAVHLYPDHVPAQLLLAGFYFQKGQLELALIAANAVIAKQPLLPAYMLRAKIHFQKQRWAETLHDASAVIDLVQDVESSVEKNEALLLRARTYVAAGQLEDAVRDYLLLIHKQPQDTVAFEEVGQLFLRMHDFARAVWVLKKAAELKPGDARVWDSCGLALLYQGSFDDAAEHFYHALDIDANYADAYHHLGLLSFTRGDIKTALRCYDQAIALGLQEAGVFYNRARAFFEQCYMKAAEQDVLKALALDPQLLSAQELLGDIYGAQQQWDKAIDCYNNLVSQKPAAEAVQLLFRIGMARMNLRHYAQAVKDWDRLLNQDPLFKDAYFQRALAYSYLGEDGAAQKDNLMVLHMDSHHAEAYYNLGNILYRKGELQAAVRCYDAALRCAPGWKAAYHNRALAKEGLGQHAAAKEDYQRYSM